MPRRCPGCPGLRQRLRQRQLRRCRPGFERLLELWRLGSRFERLLELWWQRDGRGWCRLERLLELRWRLGWLRRRGWHGFRWLPERRLQRFERDLRGRDDRVCSGRSDPGCSVRSDRGPGCSGRRRHLNRPVLALRVPALGHGLIDAGIQRRFARVVPIQTGPPARGARFFLAPGVAILPTFPRPAPYRRGGFSAGPRGPAPGLLFPGLPLGRMQ